MRTTAAAISRRYSSTTQLQQRTTAVNHGKLGKIVEKEENFAQKKEKSKTSARKRSRAWRRIVQNRCKTREFGPKGGENRDFSKEEEPRPTADWAKIQRN